MANVGQNHIFFEMTDLIPYGDKFAHAFLYGFLTLFLNIALKCRAIKIHSFYLQAGSLTVLTFAILEELAQYSLPNRTLDMIDLAADVVGVCIFTYLSIIYRDQRLAKQTSELG